MLRRSVVAFLFCLVLTCTAIAQSTFRGGLAGTVVDPQGAIIPGATVSVTNVATGQVYKAVSTSAGDYAIQDLPLGDYTVTVSFTGFATTKVDQVRISAGVIFSLPVTLTIATSTTTVEVDAAALTLDTTTQERTFTLPKEEVQDVPLNGRSYTTMLNLLPGNTTGTTRQVIDGVDNNDPANGSSAANQGGVGSIPGTLIPIDSIDEYSAQGQTGVESGGYSGYTVNLAIKSGTNHVHGSLYYFNRNEFFAAWSPFAKANNLVNGTNLGKAKIRFQEYGGSIGGPILKDKYFYFLNFERQQYILGQGTSAQTEPSAQYVAAALALLAEGNPSKGVPANSITPANIPAITMAQGLVNTLWQPFMLTGGASAGNWVPANTAQTGYSNNLMVKLDQALTPKNRLSERWYWGQGSQTAPLSTSNNPWYFQVAGMHIQNLAVTLNSELNARASNQVLMGVDYFNQPFDDANPQVDATKTGFNVGLGPGTVVGAPGISISGFDGAGGTSFQSRHDFNAHMSDIVTLTLGKHNIRAGGEYRRTQIYEVAGGAGTSSLYNRGYFAFSGNRGLNATNGNNGVAYLTTPLAYTYNGQAYTMSTPDSNVKALADFLQLESNNAQLVNGLLDRIASINNFNLYAQDSFQIRRDLNVTYGLRWDFLSPIGDDQRDLSVFRAGAPVNQLDPYGGLAVVGADISEPYKASSLQLAPRLGLSWQPSILPSITKGMVIRAAMGLYFDTPTTNSWLSASGLLGNPAGTRPDYNQKLTNPNLFDYISGKAVPGQTTIFPTSPTLPGKCAAALTTPTCPTLSIAGVDPNFTTGDTTNISANVQKALGSNAILEVGYVGVRARHLRNTIDLNQTAYGAAFDTTTVVNGFSNQQVMRPYYSLYPNFGGITQTASYGTTNANSLQTRIRARNWHGLIAELSYALSTSYGTGSIEDYNYPRLDYGSNNVITNQLKGYWTYSIPKLKRGPSWLTSNGLTSGWQTTGTLWFHGAPSITAGDSASCNTSGGNTLALTCTGLGTGEASPRAALTGAPRFCPTASLTGCTNTGAPTSKSYVTAQSIPAGSKLIQWFNPYSVIAPGEFAPGAPYPTTAPGAIHGGPGYADVDMSVFKNFTIHEGVRGQFRGEMFNVFNRYNYKAPTLTAGNTAGFIGDYGYNQASTGQVTSTTGGTGAPGIGAGEPFNVQLALKILF